MHINNMYNSSSSAGGHSFLNRPLPSEEPTVPTPHRPKAHTSGDATLDDAAALLNDEIQALQARILSRLQSPPAHQR